MGQATIRARVLGTQILLQGLSEFLSGGSVKLSFGEPFVDSAYPEDGWFVAAVMRNSTVSETPGVVGSLHEFAAAEITSGSCTLVFPSLSPENPAYPQYDSVVLRLLLVDPDGNVAASSQPMPMRILQFTAAEVPAGETSVFLTIGGVRYEIVGGLRGASPVLGLRNLDTGVETLCLVSPLTGLPAFDPETATGDEQTAQVAALTNALNGGE